MRLEWKKTHSNTHATAEIGRFKFICTNGFDNYKWKVYQHYEGTKPSKEIITLGEVEAKTIDEAIEFAEDLICELIPDNRTAVSLPDGSTLIVMPKDDGGDYPGVYIYRLEPDHEGELDIACIEMPKGKEDAVAVYVYGNPEVDEFTYSTRIPTGGASE